MWFRICIVFLLVTLAFSQEQFTRRRNPNRNRAADTRGASRRAPASRGSAQFGSRTPEEVGSLPRQPAPAPAPAPSPAPSRRAPARQSAVPARDPARRGSASGNRVFQPRTTQAPDAPSFDTECPEKNGFFADAFQCDRYYVCRDFVIAEKLCADGLVFNDYSTAYGRCDQPFSVNCTGREELQPAKPSGDCLRRNGYFPDPNPKRCGRFIFCVDGVANRINCPAGLVFSLETGTCQWPDQAGRTGCSSEEVLSFQCPGAENGKVVNPGPGQLQNPRFADPVDCQFFFSCLDGVVPRRHGCPDGRVFNDVTKQCDDVANVPECAYEE